MCNFVGNECLIPYNVDVIVILCFSIINLVSINLHRVDLFKTLRTFVTRYSLILFIF
jgi:hypothetical protein